MSGAAVRLASELNAVRSRPHEPEMSGYHVPLSRLARSPVEQHIRRLVSREERVLLVGPMGSGKTSLTAAVFSPFAPEVVTGLAPIRIPVLLAGQREMVDPAEFCRMLMKTVAEWAAPTSRIPERDVKRIRQRTARSRVSQSGGSELRLGIGAPLHLVQAEAGVTLGRQVRSIHDTIDASSLDAGWREMLSAFGAAQLVPFFVIDDADQWSRALGDADAARVTNDFFGRVVQWLARTGECGFLVAVRDSQRALRGSSEVIGQFMHVVEMPELADPPAALGAILDRRLSEAGIDVSHADVFDGPAVAMLADVYAQRRDLRTTLRVAEDAVDLAYDAGAEIVTAEAVSAARGPLGA